MKNNSFYISNGYCFLIFETKGAAQLAASRILDYGGRWRIAGVVPAQSKVAADLWTSHFSSKVHYSELGEPILLIKAEEIYWNVIIGEKIGWIVADSWTDIEPLSKNGK